MTKTVFYIILLYLAAADLDAPPKTHLDFIALLHFLARQSPKVSLFSEIHSDFDCGSAIDPSCGKNNAPKPIGVGPSTAHSMVADYGCRIILHG